MAISKYLIIKPNCLWDDLQQGNIDANDIHELARNCLTRNDRKKNSKNKKKKKGGPQINYN